jgi:GntR family phosphonate transport system transcriptional regulator
METTAGPIWHQISQTLAEEINLGTLVPGERLPASADLAARFGVNRNTVLRAISHLRQEGLVRTERGGRMYVEKFIPYRIGEHDRLEQNMRDANLDGRRELISVEEFPAPGEVAQKLGRRTGELMACAIVLGYASEVPISYTSIFVIPKYASAYVEAMRDAAQSPHGDLRTSSILTGIGAFGFHRFSARVRSRSAKTEEQRHLRMTPSESILELDVIGADSNNELLTFTNVAFSSSRVEFILDEMAAKLSAL